MVCGVVSALLEPAMGDKLENIVFADNWCRSDKCTARQFLEFAKREVTNVLGRQDEIVISLERLLDLGSHERVHSKVGETLVQVDALRVFDAEDVGHGVREAHFVGGVSGFVFLCQNHGCEDGLRLLEEGVHGR